MKNMEARFHRTSSRYPGFERKMTKRRLQLQIVVRLSTITYVIVPFQLQENKARTSQVSATPYELFVLLIVI